MTVTDTASSINSLWNQKTYQRLKLALSIGLRCQIFVAVCDDLSLRNRLVQGLQAELDYTRLVSLQLNQSHPNPVAEIAKWQALHQQSAGLLSFPTFQILGVELLIRQPASIQGLFVRHLQALARNLPGLDFNLLLWLPRPWCYTLQQSAADFWRWHTGMFEFEGEPTPVSIGSQELGNAQIQESVDKVELKSDRPLDEHSTDQQLNTLDKHKDKEIVPVALVKSESIEDAGIATQTLIKLGNLPKFPTLANFQLKPANDLSRYEKNNGIFEHLNKQNSPINSEVLNSQQQIYLKRGNYYRQAIEQGDTSQQNLLLAIHAYEQALQNWQPEPGTPQVSHILNDVGNLYWMLAGLVDSSDEQAKLDIINYLKQAISSYQQALSKIVAVDDAVTYGMIQNNLGAAYGDLARHENSGDNLQKSIVAYQESIRFCSCNTEPLKYASCQNNLGATYWHLAQQREPVENLQSAIAAYNEALSYYQPEREPLSWAMIQNNLGTAYWNLSQYQQPVKFLQMAVNAYQNALKYRTPETTPAGCAASENNLGTAYWHLATQPSSNPEAQVEFLHLCVEAFARAIALAEQLAKASSTVPLSFDLFATYNNLGLAYYHLATHKQLGLDLANKLMMLDGALQNHLQALRGYAQQSDNYNTSFNYFVKTIRTFYQEGGIQGQNRALSQVPATLLPEIMRRL